MPHYEFIFILMESTFYYTLTSEGNRIISCKSHGLK
jgi:hypothetical protein